MMHSTLDELMVGLTEEERVNFNLSLRDEFSRQNVYRIARTEVNGGDEVTIVNGFGVALMVKDVLDDIDNALESEDI